ncbi:MAG: 2-C-methyl-D-erythritol 4-phosphate cytidylyltransferase, partial [Bacteroidales bacterium]|nr:2-C-methyl-D-erythritol 4-phosphate cytidylyltransferase [Bacteroidales bacterium]
FLELAGKPVLMHTIEKFRKFESSIRIIVVLPEDHIGLWHELTDKYSFPVSHNIVSGGATRFESVKNGLQLIKSRGYVAIHDGVRPLVSRDTILRCFTEAERYGNAVPVSSPADSLRLITDQGNIPVNRHHLRLIQTPQVFDTELIIKAYQQEYSPEFTDDATLLEKTGESIRLVEGNRENIKITNPVDLIVAEALMQTMK